MQVAGGSELTDKKSESAAGETAKSEARVVTVADAEVVRSSSGTLNVGRQFKA